jgi:hypothetical protein
VKVLLVVAAVVSAIPLVISTVTDPGGSAGGPARFLSSFINSGLTMIGIATVLGVAFERGWLPRAGFADWKVADLPVLDALNPGKKGLFHKSVSQRRFEALLEVILTTLFILWWTGVVPAPWANQVRNGDMVLEPATIWTTLYWPLLAWAGVQLVSSLLGLVRPGWVRARAALEVVCGLAGLALAVVLWNAGRLVVVTSEAGGANAADVTGLQNALDLSFHLTATVMMVVLTVKIAVDLWRLFRGDRPPVSAVA